MLWPFIFNKLFPSFCDILNVEIVFPGPRLNQCSCYLGKELLAWVESVLCICSGYVVQLWCYIWPFVKCANHVFLECWDVWVLCDKVFAVASGCIGCGEICVMFFP